MTKRKDFEVNITGSVYIRDDWRNPPVGKDYAVNSRYAKSVTKGVSRRKPVGWIPPTDYSYEFTRRNYAVGALTTRQRHNSSGVEVPYVYNSGLVGGGGVAPFSSSTVESSTYVFGSHDSKLADRALVKARLKMKNSDVNLGVAFAERNATARLLGDTATRIAKAVRQLRRGNVRRAADELGGGRRQTKGKTTLERWLELQYGWRPLLDDVYGSADALSKRTGSDWRVTAKARVQEPITARKRYENILSSVDCEATGWDKAFVRIDAYPQNDVFLALSQLGITNPALVAWELVPFSFVLDWMLPIGDYLDSLDAMLGYGESWTSISQFKRVKWYSNVGASPHNYPSGSYTYITTGSFEGECDQLYLKRTASKGVPLPTMPRFKDPRSLTHMANGLSLLALAFGRK